MVTPPKAYIDQLPWLTPGAKPVIEFDRVSKVFDSVYAADDVRLKIYRGEFFTLLGASGCGKTTLLRMLAGFEQPSQGRILIDGVDVTALPPYQRPVNMMFQNYALFPHLSVADNIAYGLKQAKMPKLERRQRVEEMLALVQIETLAKRKPHQLSGGQKQRVALARALANHPRILLLDEPLGALDKNLREDMQFELVNLQEKLGITFVVVTHDQEEAMTMSSRIALLNEGRIEQLDTPRRLYEFPATRYAAHFVGISNLFTGFVEAQEDDLVTVRCADLHNLIQVRHSQPLAIGMEVSIALRPEKIHVSALTESGNQVPAGFNQMQGQIQEIAYLGDVSIYYAKLESGKTVKFTQSNTQALAEQPMTWQQSVNLSWSAQSCGLLTQ